MSQCCTDHVGNPKQKYKSREEAELAAERRKEEGVELMVYPCDKGDGWHLTSRNAPPVLRPKNVMTQQERGLYSKPTKNLIGNVISENLEIQLKDRGRRKTLFLLKKNVEEAQLKLDKKKGVYQNYKKNLFEMKKNLSLAEQDVRESKRKLSNAQLECNSAQRRIRVKLK